MRMKTNEGGGMDRCIRRSNIRPLYIRNDKVRLLAPRPSLSIPFCTYTPLSQSYLPPFLSYLDGRTQGLLTDVVVLATVASCWKKSASICIII